MKQKPIIIVAILVIAVVVGYFVLSSDAVGYFTEDWGVTGENGLTGVWRITPYAITESGERILLKAESEGLWVKYPGAIVTDVEYVIEGQATRDIGIGTFTSVEVNAMGSNAILEVYKLGTMPSSLNSIFFTKDGFETVTMAFSGDETTTPWTEVISYTVPVDVEEYTPTPLTSVPYTGPDTLAGMTADWEVGSYNFDFRCTGTITIQGKNSDVGDGDVLSTSLPGDVHTIVMVGDYTVSINWDSAVTYS